MPGGAIRAINSADAKPNGSVEASGQSGGAHPVNAKAQIPAVAASIGARNASMPAASANAAPG
jgi:hypothetical protein